MLKAMDAIWMNSETQWPEFLQNLIDRFTDPVLHEHAFDVLQNHKPLSEFGVHLDEVMDAVIFDSELKPDLGFYSDKTFRDFHL